MSVFFNGNDPIVSYLFLLIALLALDNADWPALENTSWKGGFIHKHQNVEGITLHGLNMTSILDAWEAGKEAETNGAEARKAVSIILAMYESAKKGGVPVPVR